MSKIEYGHLETAKEQPVNRRYKDLLAKCRKLGEYAEFVACMREFLASGQTRNEAARNTIRECMSRGILTDVLTRCRTEVLEVLLAEYDAEKTWAYLRKEAQEIGLEEGLKKGREEGREEGEDRLARLIEFLMNSGRTDEIGRAVTERAYRNELYLQNNL